MSMTTMKPVFLLGMVFLAAAGCSGGHDRPQGDADANPDFGSDLDSLQEWADPGDADGEERYDVAPDPIPDVHGDDEDAPDGNGCIPAGCVPVEGDMDCDMVPDETDVCPACSNECQEDRDGDGIGDVCDDSCEERCIGGSCGAEGIAGCNCTACPEGTFCTGDAGEPVGICDGSGRSSPVQRATLGDYLRGRAFRRFERSRLRLVVTAFVVPALSNNCRIPCSNSSTALSRAPSCPTRTIATDMCKSNEGGRRTSTMSRASFPAMKREGSSPTP